MALCCKAQLKIWLAKNTSLKIFFILRKYSVVSHHSVALIITVTYIHIFTQLEIKLKEYCFILMEFVQNTILLILLAKDCKNCQGTVIWRGLIK